MGKTKKDSKPTPNNQPNKVFFKQILRQLEEYSVGGFMLFYFNPDTGCPQSVMLFETPVHSLALQKFATDWCNIMQSVYLDNIERGVKEATEPSKEDEE